jgi:hypothetical protein
LVIFDGTAGQIIDLWKTSLSGLGACALYLFAPNGSQILLDRNCGSNGPPLPVTLPATGTYTIGVEPSGATGSITLTPTNVTGAIAAGGPPVTVTTTVGGQDAWLTFTGAIGQQVYVEISNVTTSDAFVYLVRPDGSYQASVEIGPTTGSQFYYLDTTILEMTGTYTLWVQHVGSYFGSEQLYLGNAPTPVTGTISTNGTAVTLTTTTAWQSAELTFSGNVGDTVYLQVTNITTPNAFLNLVGPDGTVLRWVGIESGSGYWYYELLSPLPATGIGPQPYTLWIQSDGTDTGSETVELWDVPPSSGSITSGGSAVTVTHSTPGQEQSLFFSGTAGQDAYALITNVTTQDAYVSLMTSNGTVLGSIEIGPTTGSEYYDFEWDPLPATDSYIISIEPVGSYTGSETVQLFLSNDLSGTMTPGGSAVTVTTASPGQNGEYTFSGTAGQNVFLLITGVTSLQDAYVDLVAPDGTDMGWVWVDSDYGIGYQLGTYGSIPLSQTGTYTLWFTNYSPTAGNLTLQLYNPPADVTGTLTVGGSPVTVTTTSVGQGISLTFSGTAGQSVTTAIGTDTTSAWGLAVITNAPDNALDGTFFGPIPGTSTFGPDTLPATGTYTIWIPAYMTWMFEEYGPVYGTETVQVY